MITVMILQDKGRILMGTTGTGHIGKGTETTGRAVLTATEMVITMITGMEITETMIVITGMMTAGIMITTTGIAITG